MDSITPDLWISDPDNNLLKLKELWNEIPELSLTQNHSLKDGQLVRFRGMIQDMSDPTIYMSQYEVVNETTGLKEKRSGKYRDVLYFGDEETILHDSDECVNGDRRSYYCVSIPGLNHWATPKQTAVNNESMASQMSDDNINKLTSQTKRSAEEGEDQMDTDSADLEPSKRRCTTTGDRVTSSNLDLNFPVLSDKCMSCVINLYDFNDEDVRINEILDVIGFVSFTGSCDEFEHLPASLVPRIHAVSFKKLAHSNPLYLTNEPQAMETERLRADLLLALTQLTLGDPLAAEYLLCNLISKIYKRKDVIVLGKFSMNLSRVPLDADYPLGVYKVLQNLLPKTHFIPITLEYMNKEKLIPEKDYETNRLKSGALQLSNGTHLVLDETKMEAGKLEENGIINLKALEGILASQKIDYNFKFYKIEYPVDYPVLILSEGKSLLPADVHVVLKPEDNCSNSISETFLAVDQFLKEPLLSEIRLYLTSVANSTFDLPEELFEVIQEDYVKMRQNDEKVTEFDLHRLLVFARLLALSHGKATLTKDIWDEATRMESLRKARLTPISRPGRS